MKQVNPSTISHLILDGSVPKQTSSKHWLVSQLFKHGWNSQGMPGKPKTSSLPLLKALRATMVSRVFKVRTADPLSKCGKPYPVILVKMNRNTWLH
ncbi:hypothetical protein D3C87_1182830 [compost metagenome]